MIFKNKLRRKYMSQVKAFFPVKTKNERKFLKIISNSVDDYCTEHSDANIQDIYEQFGSPQETINNYIMTTLKPYFKKVKRARTFRYISFILIAVIMIASTLKVIKLHNDYKTLKNTTIYDYEETIE